jgi:membrane-bound ClpP family serine protease
MDTQLLWGLILLGIALVIVGVEVFVPSAGVLGLTALVVAIAGVVLLYKYDTPWGVAGTGLVLFGGPVIALLGLRIFPQTPMGRRLILGAQEEDAEDAPPAVDRLAALVGQEGVVVTDLRPVGVIRIGQEKVDALSETRLVRAGERVRVVSVEGGTRKVRPV